MDNVDTQQPVEQTVALRPGGPLQEWQIMQPIIRVTPGKPSQEVGIRAADGTSFPFLHGESITFIKNGTTRNPTIRLSDGSEVGFEQWRATRRAGVQEAVDRVGGEYAFIYMDLLQEHPYLEQLDIDTATPEQYKVLKHTAGFWLRPEAGRSNPKIVVNAEPGKANYASLFETREVSARRAAELMGVPYEYLKQRPDLLGLFIFFHEVGHADDYIRNYHMKPGSEDPSNENQRVRDVEMNSLPVPGSNPVRVREMHEQGELAAYYEKYKAHYQTLGIASVEDLMQKHEAAYHDLPSEVYADRFSAAVIKKHAERLGIETKTSA